MRKLLFFLLMLISFSGFSQHHFIVSPGEYVPMGLDITTSTPYYINASGSAIPVVVSGNPGGVSQAIGGGHHAAIITGSGGLYTTGQNPSGAIGNGTTNDVSGFYHVVRDSIGNSIDSVKQAIISGTSYGAYWWTGFVTTTGKMYIMGNTQGGNEGNNTYGCVASTYPVQITASGNPYWEKIQGGYTVVGLDSAGNVWTWGGNNYNFQLGQGNSPANYRVPNKITLPGGTRAIDIASNGAFSYAVLNNGHIMAWAQQYFEDYVGMYPTSITATATDITSFLNAYLPSGWTGMIQQLTVSCNITLLQLTNGTLWTWGGTPCGEAGTGQGLPNYATLVHPYFWDFGPHEAQQYHPTRVAPGKSNFAHVYTGLTNSFYVYADDTQNRLYSWGRNKGGSIDNGIMSANQNNGAIGAYYPDSWEELYIEEVKPQSITVTKQTTSPYCILHPSGDTCNTYSIPAHSAPVATLTTAYSGGVIYTNGSGSHASDGRYINHYLLTQTSGPATLDLAIQTGANDTISSAGGSTIPQGTYGFKLKVVNDSWDSSFATATVVVGQAPPTVTARVTTGTITSPILTDTLLGTAVGNSGATITSVQWTQISGPSCTINSPTSDTTSVTLTATGSYVFNFKATDSNSQTTTSGNVTITVNAAPAGQPFLLRRRGWAPFYLPID